MRADIAKLQGPQRAAALNSWADAVVAKERQAGGVGLAIDDTVRTLSRGSFVGPALDEANAATSKVLQTVTGGMLGSDYDEALAYQRARDRAVDKSAPVLSTVGKIAGGVAGGIGALSSGAGAAGAVVGGPLAWLAPAPTLAGRVGQGMAVGGAYGAVGGFAGGEGGEGSVLDQAAARAGEGVKGAALGTVIGGALPPLITGGARAGNAVYDAVSPTAARVSASVQNKLLELGLIGQTPQRAMPSVGAAGAPPSPGRAPISGAEAAADQVIANQLARANVSAVDLRQRAAQAVDTTQMGPGAAQNMLATVELDPSLQRLAGTIARQQPEAANIGQRFLFGRQTGVTPRGSDPAAVAETGIPTRPMMAPPITGAEAEASLGRGFGTPSDSLVPMGQFERVRDAFRKALGISDRDFEGAARSAGSIGYRVDQQIQSTASREAAENYPKAYATVRGDELAERVQQTLQRWEGGLVDEPTRVAQIMQNKITEVMRAVGPGGVKSRLERLDKVKQLLDDDIETAMKSTSNKDRYLGRKLVEFKQDLLTTADTVPTGGANYKTAREAFAAKQREADALQLGRDVMKDESVVTIDAYRKLATEAERKMFRLGMLDWFEKRASTMKRTQDVTQLFENPRIQDVLAEIIPAARPVPGTSATTGGGQRFGQYLGNEKSMVETRNTAFGGSQTAKNLADDRAADSVASMFETLRTTPSIAAATMKFVQTTLDKTFGFRADTAALVARKLFTADPGERARLLRALDDRLGPSRAAQLARIVADHQKQLIGASGTAMGGATAKPAD